MEKSIINFQNDYNQYLEEQVKQTLGSIVGKNFRALQHAGGFNYMTNDGLRYNNLTIKCLDSLLTTNKDSGTLDLEEGGFSKLYHEVLTSARYTHSQASQKSIQDAAAKYDGQVDSVIAEYNAAGLPELKATKPAAAILEIYKNCAKEFKGDVTKNCNIIPDSLANFKRALQTLNNVARESLQLVMNEGNKNAVLESIIENITAPDKDNGGIPIDLDKPPYYVGYENIPKSNTLIGSLGTSENSLTIDVSGESYDGNSMNVHVGSKITSPFHIPIFNVIGIEAKHESTFDMDKLKTSQTGFSAQITYSGITEVPVHPVQSSPNGQSGWYDTEILKEIRGKSGHDEDGYKFIDNRFKVDKLFGGDLARLKRIIICKTPAVTFTLSNVDLDYAKSVFSTQNNVSVTLFGFIKLGQHENSYSTQEIHYDESTRSVTLTFGEPNVSGTIPSAALTAFILGGEPDYPGKN